MKCLASVHANAVNLQNFPCLFWEGWMSVYGTKLPLDLVP